MSDMEPIEATDGTQWIHAPLPEGEWTGWQPGEDGVWIRSQAEMEQDYPEVLAYWAKAGDGR